MINSNERKLLLSGWLKHNSLNSYNTSLKLQKFLFLCESFSKVRNNSADFSYLKGFRNGPVFSNVYGDYTYEKQNFDIVVDDIYMKRKDTIDIEIVKKVDFIVKILTSNELSVLTHKMNIWKSKKERILNGEKNVALSESDFNGEDVSIIKTLDGLYTEKLINGSSIIDVGKNHFIVANDDIKKVTIECLDALYVLSNEEELQNPVYIDFDKDGRMLID